MIGLAAQFVDLSGRLQLTNKATNTILQDIKSQAQKADARHAELLQMLITKDQYNALESRLARMEQLIANIQRDVGDRDYSSRFNQLHDTLRSSHLSLSENLQGHLLNGKPLENVFESSAQLANLAFIVITASTPRMGFFIFLVIAFQVVLVISYVIYKRRRANMPKKFL
jgi:mannose-binding lectin 1